jgi:hypothetical protein
MATSLVPVQTIDDLIEDLISQGNERQSAIFKVILGIENRQIFVLDPHSKPLPSKQVLPWLVKFLQALAVGSRPPILPFGMPEYLRNLRFRTAERSSARAGAGRPEEHDWDEAKQYAFSLLKEKGDPKEPHQVKGWTTNTDVATAVQEHLQKHAPNQEPPDLNTVRNRVPGWLKEYRALN